MAIYSLQIIKVSAHL